MTSASEPRRASVERLVVAVGLPLAVVALAYGLWFVSDRMLYVGSLDRATFGWVVVVPLWLAAPLVAARAWRGLDAGHRRLAATALGLLVGVPAAVLLGLALQPNCVYGAAIGPSHALTKALALAVTISGGLAVSSLHAARLAASGRAAASLAVGAGLQAAFFGASLLLATLVLQGPTCPRPG